MLHRGVRWAAVWALLHAGLELPAIDARADGVSVAAPSLSHELRVPRGIPDVDRAVDRFRARDFEQCRALLKAACAAHPEISSPDVIFARLCIASDRAAMGRAALERAVVERPGDPESYVLFGILALHENRFTDAWLQFDCARRCATSSKVDEAQKKALLLRVYSGLAAAAEARDDWGNAASALESLLQVDPGDGQAHRRLGIARFHQGRRDEALTELKEAVRYDPAIEPPGVILGWLFSQSGDQVKAAEWMESAVKLAPGDARAHLGRAAWLLEHEHIAEARAEAAAAARLDPASPDIRTLAGFIARFEGDHAAAELAFRTLHVENPGSFMASNLWALSLVELPSEDARKRALQIATSNAQLYPGSAEAQTTLGWTAFRNGDPDRAEQALRAAMASGKGTSETAYFLARILAVRGNRLEVPALLKTSLAAPGRFAFRAQAREWLDQLDRGAPTRSSD